MGLLNSFTGKSGLCLLYIIFLGLTISLLRVPPTEAASLPVPIVWGDGDSWADTNSNWTYDGGEAVSPVAMVAVDYGPGKGRVVGFSNGDTLSKFCLSKYDNLGLGTNIIDWLAEANGNGQQVLFDHHTWEYYWEIKTNKKGKIKKGYFSKFPRKLRKKGYQVDVLDYRSYGWDPIPITSACLQGYDVFVMPTPMTDFADSELAAIRQFVNDGGGLFLFTTLSELDWRPGHQYVPPGEGDNIQVIDSANQVAELFDFRWNVDAVNDLNHYSGGDDLPGNPDTNQPLFAASRGSFANHPLTQGITRFGTYELVPSITVIPEPVTLLLLSTGFLALIIKKRRIRP